MMNPDLSILEKNIGYAFDNRDFLEHALRHSSYVNELLDKDTQDNERLEFLGDSVLSIVISHLLIDRFPELNEGDLSKIRSSLVNEFQLSAVAQKIELGQFIMLGKGEMQTGGQGKSSILADTVEALLAAIYLDGGFNKVFEVIRRHFSGLFADLAFPEKNQDFKSRIQEIVQATIKSQPEYNIIKEMGPDHDKIFEVELVVGDVTTRGIGKNKKAAEQAAAQEAVKLLNQ
ncbi:MAG: ribonuclease III [Desulfobacteraceae bacterium]|nr:ribonuclease III [Desulfobacteraceae bacterium]